MRFEDAEHAYGPADDLPPLLHALRHGDVAARADALHWLRATVVHQGTRYPASALVVPALVDLVLHAPHPDRRPVLDLLADLAVGDADRCWSLGFDPEAASPDVVAVRRALLDRLEALLSLLDDAPGVRAATVRLLAGLPEVADRVRAAAAARADDPSPAARASFRLVAGAYGLPDALATARALPDRDPDFPWFGGDPVRVALELLRRAPPTDEVRAALVSVLERGDDARAAAAAVPALAVALDRLPPARGWTARAELPPTLARCARALVDRPWLALPEVWKELSRQGLPDDPDRLRALLDGPRPAGILDRPVPGTAETGRALSRRLGQGAGGPTVVRAVGGGTVSFVAHTRGRPSTERRRAVKALGAAGPGAVERLVALAEEEELPLEALSPCVDVLVASNPIEAIEAEVVRLAEARAAGPRRVWDARGEVRHHHARVLLLAIASRCCAPHPPPEALDALVDSALEAEVFHPELLRYLDRLPSVRRTGLIRSFPAPRLGGELLARCFAWLDDTDLVGLLAGVDPAEAVAALPARRAADLARPLAERLRAFLAERRRWMRDRVGEEEERLAAAVTARGPLFLDALRAVAPPELGSVLARRAAPRRAAAPAPSLANPPAPVAVGDAATELARATVDLVLAEPLFGWLLGRIDRVFTTDTPTMGLWIGRHGRIALLVHPTWFLEGLRHRRQRVGALRHEVLHLLFGHPFRADLQHADLEALGTAADLAVNRFLPPATRPPDARCHPWSPPVDEEGALEDNYRVLLAHRIAADGPPGSAVWHSDHRFWRQDPNGGGVCDLRDTEDAGRGFDALVDEGVRSTGGDALFGLAPGLAALVLQAVERRRATLDWRRLLRLFAANSRRTTVHHTLKRPSRRYGTLPGLRVRRHHRVAVAVDTSGSVDGPTLGTFFVEIEGLRRAGSEVVVVECDAAVQRVWRYDGVPPGEVQGRGGTAFEPVLRWLHGPGIGRFDAVIYLTDGAGPAPETRPPCPLLWVLTPEGYPGEHLRFGRTVQIRS